MAKKTLITGGGKNRMSIEADKIVNGRSAAWISRLTELRDTVDEKTEVIVVEGGNNISLDKLKAFISSVNVSFRPPYGATVVRFPMPDLIVIDNRISSDTRHFDEVINCN